MTCTEFELNLIILGFENSTLLPCNNGIREYRLGSITVDVFEDNVDIYRPNKWNLSFRTAIEFLIEYLEKKDQADDS